MTCARCRSRRKDELLADQAAAPPYGTNLTFPLERYTHLHLTSGTVGEQLRVLQTAEDWRASRRCFALVLREAGISSADRVALPFPFGAYLQFWAAAAGVEDVGALALPLGRPRGPRAPAGDRRVRGHRDRLHADLRARPDRRRARVGARGRVRVGRGR